MTIPSNELGRRGEDMAVTFLEQQGCQIITRNFRNKLGEIDIIAKDKSVLCFVEVKLKKSASHGSPFEAVTPRKQRKLVTMAMSYLQSENLDQVESRFDVIAVYLEEHSSNRVEIIKNAFGVNW